MRRLTSAILFALVLAHGQGRAPQTPKAAAPIDLTGYWVSVVTEDWRWRMVTPKKGDYASVPLNPEGRKVADAWDPTKDAHAKFPIGPITDRTLNYEQEYSNNSDCRNDRLRLCVPRVRTAKRPWSRFWTTGSATEIDQD